MRKYHSNHVLVIILIVILAAFTTGEAVAQQPKVLAAWSQVIGEASVALAGKPALPTVEMRFVMDKTATCGDFSVSSKSTASGSWVGIKGLNPLERTGGPFADVRVCSFTFTDKLAGNWYSARLEHKGNPAVLTSKMVGGDTQDTVGKSFTAGNSDGAEIIVAGPLSIGTRHQDGKTPEITTVTIGDTGCRGQPSFGGSRMKQDCDPASWPFSELAETAAKQAPDLVIHVGDYRYFLEDEVTTDSWLYWQKDFFPAAQPLLLAAPWVFTRGNHESCSNFGAGYFLLFGPSADIGCQRVMAPWYFDVMPGGGSSGKYPHRFVVIDTNDHDADVSLENNFTAAINITKASGAPVSSWWITHIPGINLVYYGEREHAGDDKVFSALQDAIGQGSLCTNGQCRPSLFLLGHEHLFQSLIFTNKSGRVFPEHYIVGHSGVKLDDSSPAETYSDCTYGFSINENTAADGRVTTQISNGFVTWTRNESTAKSDVGWTAEMFWAKGQSERVTNPKGPAPCQD